MEAFPDPFGTLWEHPVEPSEPYFFLAVIFIRKSIFAAIYMLFEGFAVSKTDSRILLGVKGASQVTH